ncbi:hypothetical protein Tco_0318013 [Tanacetum coccineum]
METLPTYCLMAIVGIKRLLDDLEVTAAKGLEYGRYGISKVLDTTYRGFLGVGTTFDIFKNILFPYGLNTVYWSFLDTTESPGYGVLVFESSWFLVKCRHRYAVSSLMDTAYRMSEQNPNAQYFHVFGSLCNPTNDHDDLGKIKPKADISIFIGYSDLPRGFHIYNHQTKKITETIHVKFDELTAMASKCNNSGPGLKCSNFQDSSDEMNEIPSHQDLDNLFGPLYEEYYTPRTSEVSNNSAANTLDVEDTPSPSSIIVEDSDAPQIGVDNRRITLIVIRARANSAVVVSLMEFVLVYHSLSNEFAVEFILPKSIPPEIEEVEFDTEGDILFLESLLYDNSSPRPPEALQANSNAIESLPPSHIPVADNDSLMEEIDLFLADDGSIPPGIESDDVDSLEDIPVDVPNVLPTHPILEQDFIPTSEFFAYVVWIFLPFLAYPVIPPSLLSCGDEDTIFDPGISKVSFF